MASVSEYLQAFESGRGFGDLPRQRREEAMSRSLLARKMMREEEQDKIKNEREQSEMERQEFSTLGAPLKRIKRGEELSTMSQDPNRPLSSEDVAATEAYGSLLKRQTQKAAPKVSTKDEYPPAQRRLRLAELDKKSRSGRRLERLDGKEQAEYKELKDYFANKSGVTDSDVPKATVGSVKTEEKKGFFGGLFKKKSPEDEERAKARAALGYK